MTQETKIKIKKRVTKPAEKPEVKPEAKLEENNKKVTTQKVVINRELLYIYPKGCIDTLARKAFRQKVRNKKRDLLLKVAELKGQDKAKAKEVLDAFMKEHYVNP